MGFSTLIDILGSTLIGGMLLLILFRLHDANSENLMTYGAELITQQNLVATVEVLEYDFRKIGYCKDWEKIPDPSRAIISADSNSIKYLTDVGTGSDPNGDGIVDTMHYYLGPASDLIVTDNPRDRMLYRVINGATPAGSNLGITEFKLKYFNALGDSIAFPITVPGEIYTMQINITVESPNLVASYLDPDVLIASSAFWRQIRLAARNIRNR